MEKREDNIKMKVYTEYFELSDKDRKKIRKLFEQYLKDNNIIIKWEKI